MDMHWMVRTGIIGLVVGSLIRWILPGRETSGIFPYILLGIAGSFLATFAGRFTGLYHDKEPAGIIMNIVGAVMLPAVLKQMEGNPK